MQCSGKNTCWVVRGGRAPGRQVRASQHGVATQPLGDLLGRQGVLDVLPPGQGGTQQAQGLPSAGGTLQNPVHLLQQATGSHDWWGWWGWWLQQRRRSFMVTTWFDFHSQQVQLQCFMLLACQLIDQLYIH